LGYETRFLGDETHKVRKYTNAQVRKHAYALAENTHICSRSRNTYML
jgi:hypothetical protein